MAWPTPFVSCNRNINRLCRTKGKNMKRVFAILTIVAIPAVMLATVASLAQQRRPPTDVPVVVQGRVGPGPEGPGPADTMIFVASEMGFGGKVVKGAPYSAEAVSESIQTLSDGNRIVNKTTSVLY